MKLIAVYNVFDGEELLEGSIKQIRNHVDEVYAVVQTTSYNGIEYIGGLETVIRLQCIGLIDKVFKWKGKTEIQKRQYCIDVAIKGRATHFINLDCDEYYVTNEFSKAKEQALKMDGSYCKIKTYFGTKELTIGLDNYYVPFIHPITTDSKPVNKYPVIVDPTRRLKGNPKEVNCTMHHFSWVRNNIDLKVNTNTSKKVIIKNGLLQDYRNAKEGLFVKHYGKTLKKVENNEFI